MSDRDSLQEMLITAYESHLRRALDAYNYGTAREMQEANELLLAVDRHFLLVFGVSIAEHLADRKSVV